MAVELEYRFTVLDGVEFRRLLVLEAVDIVLDVLGTVELLVLRVVDIPLDVLGMVELLVFRVVPITLDAVELSRLLVFGAVDTLLDVVERVEATRLLACEVVGLEVVAFDVADDAVVNRRSRLRGCRIGRSLRNTRCAAQGINGQSGRSQEGEDRYYLHVEFGTSILLEYLRRWIVLWANEIPSSFSSSF